MEPGQAGRRWDSKQWLRPLRSPGRPARSEQRAARRGEPAPPRPEPLLTALAQRP